MKKLLFFLLLGAGALAQPPAQADTIPITLSQAEEQFVKSNFQLLAQHYNVDAAKAMIRQAGLFNNPNIYYENNIYNRYSGKYFPTETGTWGDYKTQGEFVVQYNWLFNIAGKRNKQVQVAKTQAEIAQYQFDDLVRTLVFTLRTDFFQLYYGVQSLKLYAEQIAALEKIVAGFEIQYKNGNSSLREVTRMRALLFSLQNERLTLLSELQNVNAEFAILMNNGKSGWYKTQLNEEELITKYTRVKIVLADLVAQAMQSRPDLKTAQAQVTLAEANLKLQKAAGVPDVMAQGVFDRNGSYIPNYHAIGISVPIAIFNRNQGNVAAAKVYVDAAAQLLQAKQVAVQNEVYAASQKLLETEQVSAGLGKDFAVDFNTVLAGARENYEKKNLSLIEFVDLFAAFKENFIQQNRLRAQRLSAYEELNFATGKDLFKQ